MNRSAAISGDWDVAVVGGGPSGLAAATRLKRLGVERVLVIEREAEAGGIPRHCGHPPFGFREFRRVMTGPDYAQALVDDAGRAGVEIATRTTVTGCGEGGRLIVSSDAGVSTVKARRVILATGVRETPRSARFVGGGRPAGVLTTGALQSTVYLSRMAPCRNPVIVGTELVSFSALLTCRHGGIRPRAMIEENAQVTARSFARMLPAVLGVPLLLETRVDRILGRDRVEGVEIVDAAGGRRTIDCDGIVFTGRFMPEATLPRMGHLTLDPATGGPAVDSLGRCSDPSYVVTGNLLRPVETAGWCWQEGADAGERVARGLENNVAASGGVDVRCHGDAIRYAMPQRIVPAVCGMRELQLRVTRPVRGRLVVEHEGRSLWSRRISALPERRILIPLRALRLGEGAPLDIRLVETS